MPPPLAAAVAAIVVDFVVVSGTCPDGAGAGAPHAASKRTANPPVTTTRTMARPLADQIETTLRIEA